MKTFFLTFAGAVLYLLLYIYQIAPQAGPIGIAVMTFTYSIIVSLVYSMATKGLGQSCPPSVHRQMAAFSAVGMITSIHAVWVVKAYTRPSIAAWVGLVIITLTLAGCLINLRRDTQRQKLIFVHSERFATLYGVAMIAVILLMAAFAGFYLVKWAFGF